MLRIFSLGQVSLVNEIIEEKLHIMKISKPCHRENVTLQIDEIGTEKRRKLLLYALALHINIVLFFYDVVRLAALVMGSEFFAFLACFHCLNYSCCPTFLDARILSTI